MNPPAKRSEVQFVIERNCPKAEPGLRLDKFPYVIWVVYPPTPRSDLACETELPCTSAFYYRVSNDSDIVEFRRHFGLPGDPGDRFWICGDAGHVIE